jgi:hypothetical protein
MAQAVELWPNEHEALSSNPSTVIIIIINARQQSMDVGGRWSSGSNSYPFPSQHCVLETYSVSLGCA